MSEQNIQSYEWKKLFEAQHSIAKDHETEENESKIDNYFFIYDCIKNEIPFINTSFEILTGYESKGFSVDRLIEMIHPDDRPYFFSSEERGLAFTNKLMFNEHFQFILSYTYRIKASNGELITIQQQCQAIEVTPKGHLSKTLVIHKRVPDMALRPANDYKIFDKVRGIFIDAENGYKLSKREIEIINLVKEGYNSKEIAEKLFVSKFTIDTHRKKILSKTNSSNFMDLIRKLSLFEIF